MAATDEDPPLTTGLLLRAYSDGYFPMAEPADGSIRWYSPDPRAIIPIETFRPPRSLRQVVRRNRFTLTVDRVFPEVVRACSERPETWISDAIIDAYVGLHLDGWAHSVEAWVEGRLAGGLYGVALGGAFFGESMFSRESNASKVALVELVRRLREGGYLLLDTQFMNEHLRQFGTMEIPRSEYLRRLKVALATPATFPRTVAGSRQV
jgi:leucyl/phenylalanyl-tRNA--protein transferase